MTATDSGRRTCATAAAAATWSRGRGGDVVALLEARTSLLAQFGRQLDEQLAWLRPHVDGEAGVPEDLDHLAVVGKHHGREGLDAVRDRELGQVGEQQRGDATALPVVGDLERHLGSPGLLARIGRMGDDPLRVAGHGHEAAAAVRRKPGHIARGALDVRTSGEEAQGARLDRELVQEPPEFGFVGRGQRADAHGRAVAQRHVDGVQSHVATVRPGCPHAIRSGPRRSP
jgi:hypothetical protein